MIHRLITTWNKTNLMKRIAIGIVLGVILALLFPKASGIGLLGQFFVGGLRAIAPLLVFALVANALSQHQKGTETNMKKVIGILGGMGPLATADLFQKITLHTAASCDQDHPRVCIDSNTNISDRTAALLHGGADPVPEMVKSAQRLESIGADLLIMPCNTAHNFYDAVASSVSIPVLHMIAITRDALKSRGVKCAGLLATDGTVQTGIYQRTFEGSGVELLTPDNAEDQAAVMDIIYNGVKAGDLTHDATAFRSACEHLLARGAEVLILGCTELPPAFDIYHLDYPNVDPTLELALAAVRAAGCQTK